MAIRSMTGFARATGTLPDGTPFTWELRSVNGRGLDVRLRLPGGLDVLEAPLKEAAAARFARGNVSASLTVKREDRAPRLVLDPAALERALALVMDLSARMPGAASPRPEAVLALPGVLRTEVEVPDEAAEGARRAAVSEGFGEALADLFAARAAEGARLHAILSTLLDEIESLRVQAVEEAARQPVAHRERLEVSLRDLLEGERRVPEERLAAEVALLAARSDVREELDRLGAHVEAARALLAEAAPVGRKLEFLTQEFGRESNTLGAKAGSLALTRLSLELKAAVERLREQAANVE
ncbi:YicC/YloC family endoribonuclease [Roseomonas indoligenes]|uniref:YicC family protein n=1 Tax=Roseomonas indoligenes TaxID=2820811 RepID=A0A940S638_9PROT|nr:YicC/YloC family endoribonuclease [Pararoseomonas indoligenes]MBP0491652.1 YicC family protein [Pararoseomonas indoligenes]